MNTADIQSRADGYHLALEAAYYRALDLAEAAEDEEERANEAAYQQAQWHSRHSLPELLAAWVEADDLCQEDYESCGQSDFEAFNKETLELMGGPPLALPLPIPTWAEYCALKAAPLMRGSDPRIQTRKAA
ncbi:Uncharacterised protein [Kingella potus]|uniref:Uncharacterized protein n=1 Tax=Kingella potus TaxID=265175 RepID=A0A377R678_9NEIS|nr:hypothetical protein [Kingella potus]UOP00562.1 hypothetical protein LVJ84_12090 [Kingella potus]UOP01984.1 hypothetical protein LVJ84_14515 [Kingella potus]STR03044.1 Uncharacterised protein [Kingella potus]STR03065.1 Uncharacterised protein [Kingella potus]